MKEIKVSIDNEGFWLKPTENDVPRISQRIGRNVKELCSTDIRKFAENIAIDGHTFCPATFVNGIRNKEIFEQQQFFALDFDNKDTNKKVSFQEIKERADLYELPVLFAYDTLSSKGHDKFRVVFLNDVAVPDRKVAEAMQRAMGDIFPEADPSCYNDVSKMYFGGKELLYYDNARSQINIEALFRNHTYSYRERYGLNHYKEKISQFSRETGIRLNDKGLLDITISEDPTEVHGVNQSYKNGKNSPNTIIYEADTFNKIADGEIFPKKYYIINFNDDSRCTSEPSVGKTADRKIHVNHAPERAAVLTDIRKKCKLFKEFETGNRKLSHEESYGLATNLIQIETGLRRFLEIRGNNPDLYPTKKNNKWKYDLAFMKQNNYKPQCCDSYCPYRGECGHGKNIIATAHVRRGTMKQIAGHQETFHSMEDMQADTYDAVCKAYHADDKQFQIVRSMTAAGKSTSYLRIMRENPMDRFLIATPTNLLKDEIYEKACRMKINVLKTPSLEQIKDEMPDEVWDHISRLYKGGQYRSVHPYIHKILKKKNIPCLKEYMEEREKIRTFKRSIITTHRYLLNMDEERLREYDAVIIDEDIIFKSVISNQGEITVRKLKKLLKKTMDEQLSAKIKELLKAAETQTCIWLDGFEWDDEGDDRNKPMKFDIPAFCKAEYFYLRRRSDEENVKEDTIVFLKPVTFKNVKYIMVSATVSEDICRKYFGEDNVDFYVCKKAGYKGSLYQYPQKSMSRSCLKNNKGIVEKLVERFHMDRDNVITFMKEKIGSLHFGNTEGSNTLEGQDILVVGTPYHAEFLYKLAAFSMGMNFDEDEKMTLQDVVYNGYAFKFTTFENEELRAVHFWMLESELEQAVGRARLLRNECTVHLFSNFPLSQSIMVEDFDYEID